MGLFKKDHLEYEFLPEALEIEETPASPLGSLTIWMIVCLLGVAIGWSYIGKIDEAAVARGKVIPDGKLKVIQPLEEGLVTAIHINEGQRVAEGQLLIELDSTMKEVDVHTLEQALMTAKLEKELLLAEISGRNAESVLRKKNMRLSELPGEVMGFLNQLKKAKESQHFSRENTFKTIVAQRENEIKVGEQSLLRLNKRSELLTQEVNSLRTLYQMQSISKVELTKKETELFTAEKEYEMQKYNLEKAREKLNEASQNLNNLYKERRTVLLNQLVEKEKNITAIKAELTKAEKKYHFQKLLSPVNGTIHGLTVTTIGGVVTPAQPIMTIVPEGTPLIIEATLLNKDVGFVKSGQEVEIKLDTFPFQKYGIVKGKVLAVSPDAFEDEKLGPVYKMKLALIATQISYKGKALDITPGMSITAEIKTGKRRVIDFFLEPLIKYRDESLKLR